MIRSLLILLLILFPILADAEERYQFSSEAQRSLYLELVAELRCPKCQNQNIADSNAMISEDMRRKTYELVTKGQSKSEVIDFMKQRYGEFVHYQPPITPVTIWLYVLPVIFILLMLFVVLKRTPKRAKLSETADLEKAEKALKDVQ
ncbi:MAG: cytochrome c-type biogenesis protein CcmH [Aestuariibacter sp.]